MTFDGGTNPLCRSSRLFYVSIQAPPLVHARVCGCRQIINHEKKRKQRSSVFRRPSSAATSINRSASQSRINPSERNVINNSLWTNPAGGLTFCTIVFRRSATKLSNDDIRTIISDRNHRLYCLPPLCRHKTTRSEKEFLLRGGYFSRSHPIPCLLLSLSFFFGSLRRTRDA